MTKEEIIQGLQFTIEMCLFDPMTGAKRPKDSLNDLDKTTVEACEGAIKLLGQDWIPVTERLPKEQEDVLVVNSHGCISVGNTFENWKRTLSWRVDCDNPEEDYYFNPIAWQPLPEPYKENTDADSN